MKRNLIRLAVGALLIGPALLVAAPAQESAGGKPPLRAAIFVQNRASADFNKSIDTLNDLITTKLTEKGFSIIDRDVVLSAFSEARDARDPIRAEQALQASSMAVKKTEATVEDVMTSASALRTAQMINADYLVFATINSAGRETREFKGQDRSYGSDMAASIYTLRIALKVIEGRQGGTVYGDVVTATEKVAKTQNYQSDSTDTVNKLLDDGSTLIADRVESRLARIRDALDRTQIASVEFSVDCNIVNATVELDGAVIGTTPGKYRAPAGLHRLRVSHEWYATWDKMANVYSNQCLNVALELSAEGFQRFRDLETFKMTLQNQYQEMALRSMVVTSEVARAKVRNDAEAYALSRIAEGEKTMRQNSWIHDDGFVNSINKILGRK